MYSIEYALNAKSKWNQSRPSPNPNIPNILIFDFPDDFISFVSANVQMPMPSVQIFLATV